MRLALSALGHVHYHLQGHTALHPRRARSWCGDAECRDFRSCTLNPLPVVPYSLDQPLQVAQLKAVRACTVDTVPLVRPDVGPLEAADHVD